MADNRDLEQIRADIDAIDKEIQSLLNRRAGCAQRVAEIKLAETQAARERGEPDAEVVYYRPEREAQVLRRIMGRNEGPLPSGTVAHIFREVMSACLALERPLQVAYLGPEGTFTQAAAIKHFGHAAVCVPHNTIDSVFSQVESGECNYGVVPLENSTEGMVSHTLDNFIDSPLKISGEVEMAISHHLLVSAGTAEADVTRICAHQQALAQCRNWLDRHMPNVEREAVSSNGEAARMAAGTPGVAAVAGDMAAEQYDLEKLAEQVTLAEPAMAVLGECRVIRDAICQIKTAEPAIREVQIYFLTQTPFGSDRQSSIPRDACGSLVLDRSTGGPCGCSNPTNGCECR